MSMLIFKRIAGMGMLCLALAACNGETAPSGRSNAKKGGAADCAIGTGAGWSRSCLVERDGDILTVRHSDGGFRRFRIVRDGRGLIAADGAEPAHLAIIGKGWIELAVVQNRYRLPVTVAENVRP